MMEIGSSNPVEIPPVNILPSAVLNPKNPVALAPIPVTADVVFT